MALDTDDPKPVVVEDGAGGTDPASLLERSPLLDLLVEHRKINPREAERVNRLANETHEQIDILLTRLGLITEDALARLLSELLGIPLVNRGEYPDNPLLENQLGIKFLREYRVLPLAETEQGVVVAMANPLDDYALNALHLATDKPIVARVGIPAEIEAAFEAMLAGGDVEVEAIGFDGLGGLDDTGEDINRSRDLASEAPVIRLVNSIIGRAVETEASDIHIEPFDRILRVRYRIDGVLRDMQSPPNNLRAAVISRVKLMANLNIAETQSHSTTCSAPMSCSAPATITRWRRVSASRTGISRPARCTAGRASCISPSPAAAERGVAPFDPHQGPSAPGTR